MKVADTDVVLLPTDIVITTQQAAEWISTDERGVQTALSTHLTPELSGSQKLAARSVSPDRACHTIQIRLDTRASFSRRNNSCNSSIAGLRAIIVHAKDANARTFYERFGFERSPLDEFHLMLLLKDLKASLVK